MHKKIIALAVATTMACTSVYADCETYDLAIPSNVYEGQLRASLRHDLKDLAGTFLDCEADYGVNAVALSAIAALESGWGQSKLAESKHNLFGWTDADGFATFDSDEECIRHVAKVMSEKYLSEDGDYYSGGTTISDIAGLYSESESWAESVSEISDQIGGRCDETKPFGVPRLRGCGTQARVCKLH